MMFRTCRPYDWTALRSALIRVRVALARMNAAIIDAYEGALDNATCRTPFTVEVTSDGQKRLMRYRNERANTQWWLLGWKLWLECARRSVSHLNCRRRY